MPKYLCMGGYSPEAWALMVESPSDRAAAVRTVCEDAGGQLDIFYSSFGPDDWVFVCDLADDVTAAAVSVAICTSGRLRNVRTQRLITAQEAQSLLATGKALAGGYQRPGG
jgi:uncharacterized protein with GYD domain